MSLLDRIADWLDTHDRDLTRLAALFLLLAALYVGAHVAI